MVAELQYRHRVLSVTPLDQHSYIVIGILHLRYITLLCALHIYDKLIGQNTKILLLVGYLPLYLSSQEITRISNKLGTFWRFSQILTIHLCCDFALYQISCFDHFGRSNSSIYYVILCHFGQ